MQLAAFDEAATCVTAVWSLFVFVLAACAETFSDGVCGSPCRSFISKKEGPYPWTINWETIKDALSIRNFNDKADLILSKLNLKVCQAVPLARALWHRVHTCRTHACHSLPCMLLLSGGAPARHMQHTLNCLLT